MLDTPLRMPVKALQTKGRGISVTLVVNIFLVLSVLLNLLLAWKVKSLESSLLYLKSEGVLSVGTLVPPIEAKDIDNRPATIAYLGDGPPMVLYIFTPECKWCARNMENIKSLTKQVGSNHRFIGLSLSPDKLRDYVADNNLGFPVYSGLSPAFSTTYKVGGTPETLVISPEGRVLKKWTGAYTKDIQKDVEDYFKVRLPGIRQ